VLSSLLANPQVFAPLPSNAGQGSTGSFMSQGNDWWPSELGRPSSSGGQNDARYAYFPGAQRLAISQNGQVTLYNTLDHNIGGVQQQQGGYSGSLSFSSQFGTFTVDSLPVVGPSNVQAPPPAYDPPPQQQQQAPAYRQEQQQPSYAQPSSGGRQSHDEILTALERLGALHQKGVLSDQEFAAKKAELLSRL
jgi:hypothetical protein